jgi:hypothetical protein
MYFAAPWSPIVAKFRNFATKIALNGGNSLAGAQMSRIIRALKSPAEKLVGYARVSTAQQDLTRQVRALKAARCAEIFTDTASGKSRIGRPNLATALASLAPGEAGGPERTVAVEGDRDATSRSDDGANLTPLSVCPGAT